MYLCRARQLKHRDEEAALKASIASKKELAAEKQRANKRESDRAAAAMAARQREQEAAATAQEDAQAQAAEAAVANEAKAAAAEQAAQAADEQARAAAGEALLAVDYAEQELLYTRAQAASVQLRKEAEAAKLVAAQEEAAAEAALVHDKKRREAEKRSLAAKLKEEETIRKSWQQAEAETLHQILQSEEDALRVVSAPKSEIGAAQRKAAAQLKEAEVRANQEDATTKATAELKKEKNEQASTNAAAAERQQELKTAAEAEHEAIVWQKENVARAKKQADKFARPLKPSTTNKKAAAHENLSPSLHEKTSAFDLLVSIAASVGVVDSDDGSEAKYVDTSSAKTEQETHSTSLKAEGVDVAKVNKNDAMKAGQLASSANADIVIVSKTEADSKAKKEKII